MPYRTVTQSIQDVPDVVDGIQHCKKIVTYFHKSVNATNKLAVIQKQLNLDEHKLIQQVDTPSFYMLERIVE